MEDLSLQHRVASYECGADMLMKPESFMHCCQEIAEQHADLNGLGYDWGMSHHLIWVETQGDFEFIRRPRWKEVVTLRTNTGRASALQARRFVEMTDAEGQVLARADLMWVLIDVSTRRPMPLKRVRLNLEQECPPLIQTPFPALPEEETVTEVGTVTGEASLIAPQRDVDFNGHINNGSYFIWVMDTLPAALLPAGEPKRIRLNFRHESHRGDAILLKHIRSGQQTQHHLSSDGEARADVCILWF